MYVIRVFLALLIAALTFGSEALSQTPGQVAVGTRGEGGGPTMIEMHMC